jgi:hypothetical protein
MMILVSGQGKTWGLLLIVPFLASVAFIVYKWLTVVQ